MQSRLPHIAASAGTLAASLGGCNVEPLGFEGVYQPRRLRGGRHNSAPTKVNQAAAPLLVPRGWSHPHPPSSGAAVSPGVVGLGSVSLGSGVSVARGGVSLLVGAAVSSGGRVLSPSMQSRITPSAQQGGVSVGVAVGGGLVGVLVGVGGVVGSGVGGVSVGVGGVYS